MTRSGNISRRSRRSRLLATCHHTRASATTGLAIQVPNESRLPTSEHVLVGDVPKAGCKHTIFWSVTRMIRWENFSRAWDLRSVAKKQSWLAGGVAGTRTTTCTIKPYSFAQPRRSRTWSLFCVLLHGETHSTHRSRAHHDAFLASLAPPTPYLAEAAGAGDLRWRHPTKRSTAAPVLATR